MKFNSACVITPNYPHPKFPEYGAFVEKHVQKWKQLDVHTQVVAPLSFPNLLRNLKREHKLLDIAGDQIERPLYMSYSNKKIGGLQFHKISRERFLKAASKGIKKLRNAPDFFYGKFLLEGGVAALQAGKMYNKPAIADLGESRLIGRINDEELDLARKIVPALDGIVCVSERLVKEVVELGANPDKVFLAPNTVDLEKFQPVDKRICREKLNLPLDEFIVIFVGHFIERKGPLRLLKAINSLNIPVKGIFLGRGKQTPKGDKVLYTGSVPNNELPVWLNASDLFVLPTLAEGYCNAINEAMACGLPIISSDIGDIHLQVPVNTGLLVDPKQSEEIAQAIQSLYNDRTKLKKFGKQSRNIITSRFSESRPENILNWLKEIN